MNPEQKFCIVDGIKIAYLISGQGQSLLFLHGIGVSTKSYAKAIEILSQKYQVIAPDLPGFGKSDIMPKVWNYEDYAACMNKFADKLNLTNFIATGHSFGAEIALRMAAQNPHISQLVVIGATGIPIEKSVLQLLKIMLITKPRTNLRIYQNPKQMLTSRADYIGNVFRRLPHAYRMAETILKCIYGTWIMPDSIKTSAIVIWPAHDEVVNLDATKKLLQHLPNGVLKEVNEYHDWVQFKPELISEAL